jgi:hypothetical protein
MIEMKWRHLRGVFDYFFTAGGAEIAKETRTTEEHR